MPQNDPRAEMSSFNSFGIYSSSTEANQCINSLFTSAYSQGSDSISRSAFIWDFSVDHFSGLGQIHERASSGWSYGYDVGEDGFSTGYTRATIWMEETL